MGAKKQRCEQCGRRGTRGFTVLIGEVEGDTLTVNIPPITTCANKNACRKRWPKHRTDDED